MNIVNALLRVLIVQKNERYYGKKRKFTWQHVKTGSKSESFIRFTKAIVVIGH